MSTIKSKIKENEKKQETLNQSIESIKKILEGKGINMS